MAIAHGPPVGVHCGVECRRGRRDRRRRASYSRWDARGARRGREYPCSPGAFVVVGAADQRGVAVGGDRHTVAEFAVLRLELVALLCPGRTSAGEDPRRPRIAFLSVSAYEGRVAIRGERQSGAEAGPAGTE